MHLEDTKYLTTEEVMKIFFIGNSTVRFWIKTKPDFPKPFKFGRRLLWKRSEIEEYIESQRK